MVVLRKWWPDATLEGQQEDLREGGRNMYFLTNWMDFETGHLVGDPGLEPGTSRSQSERSSQLSQSPIIPI